MNNLRHSTNSPCRCVDRHTTRSLSTDCKPFNIKTSPATPDFTQKQTINLYKINSQHSFNPHTSHCQASTHGQTSDQIQLATLIPSQNTHTLKTISNTPKPTMPLIQIHYHTSLPTLYCQVHLFLPTRSYFQPSPLVLPTQRTKPPIKSNLRH